MRVLLISLVLLFCSCERPIKTEQKKTVVTYSHFSHFYGITGETYFVSCEDGNNYYVDGEAEKGDTLLVTVETYYKQGRQSTYTVQSDAKLIIHNPR